MKRVAPKPAYAVADATDFLLNEFDYPQTDRPVPAVQPTGGGGMADYLIAKTDSIPEAIAAANYVMSEDEDLTQVLANVPGLDPGVRTVWLASASSPYQATPGAGGSDMILRGVGEPQILFTGPVSGASAINAYYLDSIGFVMADADSNDTLASAGIARFCRFDAPLDGQTCIEAATLIGNTFTNTAEVVANNCLVVGNAWDQNFAIGGLRVVSGGGGVLGGVITGNRINTTEPTTLTARNSFTNVTDVIMAGNVIVSNDDAYLIHVDSLCERINISNNTIVTPDDNHGIVVEDADDTLIVANTFFRGLMDVDDTFDDIHVTGTSTRTTITNNNFSWSTAVGNESRSSVYVDTNAVDTVVVSNVFSGNYATNPIIDTGTNTQLTYPAGAFGDNFSL